MRRYWGRFERRQSVPVARDALQVTLQMEGLIAESFLIMPGDTISTRIHVSVDGIPKIVSAPFKITIR